MSPTQAGYSLRCEWGERGAEILSPEVDAVVVVDVLSFSTCVDVATGRGARVHPYRWKDESARAYAESIGAELAEPRGSGARCSLSPPTMHVLEAGDRVVLPSPNGSTLSLATGDTPTLCGCLRNARAVARAAAAIGPRVALVPAGERWPDGSLRPSLEDWLGAGAVLAHLDGRRSPEAEAAAEAFRAAEGDLPSRLRACISGRQLIGWGYPQDVEVAAEVHASDAAPRLVDGAYVA